MKRTLINTIAALAIVAGIAVCTIAPWWVVWFVCFPAIYAGVIALLKSNTNYIEDYE